MKLAPEALLAVPVDAYDRIAMGEGRVLACMVMVGERTWSPLERRVRRLAVLVPVFAVAAAVFGMLPDGIDVYRYSWNRGYTFSHTARAGGWSLVVWAVLQVLASKSLRRMTTRKSARRWFAFSLVVYTGTVIAWFIENCAFETGVVRWPAHMTAACAGSACVLVFIVLPLVWLASDHVRPSDAPTARVVT
jgi:hypothetical protein